jgi:hypothetical protein
MNILKNMLIALPIATASYFISDTFWGGWYGCIVYFATSFILLPINKKTNDKQ